MADRQQISNAGGPRPSDRWIPFYFFAFFGLLIAILVPMCFIAVRTGTGIVTDNAYEKGLAYNHDIQAKAEQDALGWKGSLDLKTDTAQETTVLFSLKDKADHVVSGADVHLIFSRPTQARLDQQTPMKQTIPGVYSAMLTIPDGVWDVRVSANQNGHNFQIAKRVQLP